MKIACIIHSLDGGGAERVMAATATRLSERGHDVILFTLDDGQKNRHVVGPNVTRIPLDLMRQSSSLLARIGNRRRRVKKVREALCQCKPNVVLSFCDRTNIAVLSALKGSAFKDAEQTARLPCVISERSDPAQQNLGWFWEWMRRRTYKTADHVIALTKTSANHLANVCGDVPISVIASAVDEPPIKSNREKACENKRIVAIGRMEREKGFDRLLNAFAMVARSHPDWSLRIFGEGSLRDELQQQAAELGIDDRLEMPGWVRPIWNELCDATIFALPSRYEGFPSALLESMACGVPSIAVDCESGPRAIIQHEQNGLLVTNNEQALASGIQQLIQDDELRERIGQQGGDVVSTFSWDRMLDEYQNVLTMVASETT